MSAQLPDKLTFLTPEQATQAIANAYQRLEGKKPTRKILGLLVAQSALETGNWKIMHNFNFGNMKLGKDEFFQVYGTHDDPTDPGARYAAFKTVEDGAFAYLSLLKRREHWWNGLQTGTAEGFITGLTTPPVYFTADVTHYTGVLLNRLKNYQDLVNKYGAASGGLLVAAIVFTLTYFGASRLRRG